MVHTSVRRSCRALAAVAVGLAFGALVAIIKGSGGGIRYDIGNDAALWVILPALLAQYSPRPMSGAVIAVVTTSAGLLSFYLTCDGPDLSSWSHVAANRTFFLVAGPVCAAIFAGLTSIVARRRQRYAWLAFALICLCEPLANPLHGPGNSSRSTLYSIEIATGVVVMLAVFVTGQATSRGPHVRGLG